GQGGRWTTGATGDRQGDPAAGPENARVMTRGITRPEGYYYTRLFTDAVLAVETASELTGAPRVAVSGASQGGGLALAAAALVPPAVGVCHRRAGPAGGGGVPRRRAVPVRHPARHHAGAGCAVHRDTRVPGAQRGPDP